MKRRSSRLFNLFAILLLGFAIYLSFFSKDEPEKTPQAKVNGQLTQK